MGVPRKSGKPRTLPVDLHEHEGRRFVIATHGVGSWVYNLRAGGGGVLSLGWSRQAFTAVELAPEAGDPVIKEVFGPLLASGGKRGALLRQNLGVSADASLDDYIHAARSHPVFELARPGSSYEPSTSTECWGSSESSCLSSGSSVQSYRPNAVPSMRLQNGDVCKRRCSRQRAREQQGWPETAWSSLTLPDTSWEKRTRSHMIGLPGSQTITTLVLLSWVYRLSVGLTRGHRHPCGLMAASSEAREKKPMRDRQRKILVRQCMR